MVRLRGRPRGGGVLDLVQEVRGGTHRESLFWVAELAGVPLAETSATDRAKLAKERRRIEQTLPAARHWQRTLAALAVEVLAQLKAGLFDRALPTQPAIGEIGSIERYAARVRHMDGATLVDEFGWWRKKRSKLTKAMVTAAERREEAEQHALLAFVQAMEPEVAAA
jgi:hypothetical protein